eukprot:TRINITY_DN7762_c0_g2_i1.p1 TRINITY_DN7762_c0_g2~~TRINITY_DN7762_c0_g2_i1.p1  ORF type:complete len:342 (+),score=76.17 TRINITY_DN7762_c0_g2_i1:44-1027(+)
MAEAAVDEYSRSLAERLTQDGVTVNFEYYLKSPNYDNRRYGPKPEYIMEHYTAGTTLKHVMDIFLSEARQVSSHFVVGKDGTCYFLVPVHLRAWHAGVGDFVYHDQAFKERLTAPTHDVHPMNSLSVGIENINAGKEPFTDEQIKTNISLVTHMSKDFDIPAANVVGHSDFTYRKIDPGPYFYPLWAALGNTSESQGRNFVRWSYIPRVQSPEILVDKSGAVVSADFEVEVLQKSLEALGHCTIDAESKQSSTQVNEKTRNAILAFTIRYMGQDILEDESLKLAWEELRSPKSNGADTTQLKVWTTNHQRILDDLLGTEHKIMKASM